MNTFWSFAQDPRPGEVYNLGGGKENAASLLECVDRISEKTGKRPRLAMTSENRIGDHICYYSDLRKLPSHFPSWDLAYSLDRIIEELIDSVSDKPAA